MDLSGTWCNQLHSTLTIDDDGKGGVTGTIVRSSGEFAGFEFPVVGSYDLAPRLSSTAVAFVTNWANGDSNGHSVTAWSGQYDADTDTIVATWMLTAETGVDPPDEWHSTLIGQDRFSREDNAPRPPTVAASRHSSSHPRHR
jgi:Avidin family